MTLGQRMVWWVIAGTAHVVSGACQDGGLMNTAAALSTIAVGSLIVSFADRIVRWLV